jgi:hypothetical protein
MATATVRKFALSPDADEVVDFTEDLDYFAEHFKELGFEQVGTYTFRYSDDECMIKGELQRSKDGFYLWIYVQAANEHQFRIAEVAESFGASLVEGGKPQV